MSVFRALLEQLYTRTIEGPGVTSVETRRAIVAHASKAPELGMLGVGSTSIAVDGPVPEAAHALIDKVCHAANRVRDEDVQELLEQGHTEDELFEWIAAATLGAARVRYDIGMRLVRGEEAP